jgi:hypothetical protein
MADDSVLFIGWNRAIHGREREALEAFSSSMAFWSKQVASGKVSAFEPIMLDHHGGDMNGFMLVRGQHANLAALADSDEFRELIYRADMCVSGIGVVLGKMGEGVMREMTRWQKLIS